MTVFGLVDVAVEHVTLALSVSGGAPGSNPVPGASQNGFAAGLRHSF